MHRPAPPGGVNVADPLVIGVSVESDNVEQSGIDAALLFRPQMAGEVAEASDVGSTDLLDLYPSGDAIDVDFGPERGRLSALVDVSATSTPERGRKASIALRHSSGVPLVRAMALSHGRSVGRGATLSAGCSGRRSGGRRIDLSADRIGRAENDHDPPGGI